VNTKPKQAQPRNERIEKDLLPAKGKVSTGFVSKAMPPVTKENMGVLFRNLYIFL
jgi:hypothetical protein